MSRKISAYPARLVDAFLDAGPARIAQADDRRAHLHGHFHHLADFFGMGQGERPAEGGEILGKDENLPTVDRAPPGDHAVAGDLIVCHAEIGASVRFQTVQFSESVRVEQRVQTFTGGEFAALVLLADALGAAAFQGPAVSLFQLCQQLFVLHGLSFLSAVLTTSLDCYGKFLSFIEDGVKKQLFFDYGRVDPSMPPLLQRLGDQLWRHPNNSLCRRRPAALQQRTGLHIFHLGL